jgi:1,4-alpha-glucan branching enzyme
MLTVPTAIAAALSFAIVGGAATYVATHSSRSLPRVAGVQPAPSTEVPVRFSIVAPGAASVAIVGDFNHWNPTSLPLQRSRDGRTWQVEVRLPLGRYTYAFLVDGKVAPDPSAPRDAGDDFGTPNSILMVHGT